MMTTEKQLSAEATTDLERAVLEWINENAEEYDGGAAGVLKDLAHGGCSSGMVSHLIYTGDCEAFYNAHQAEIDPMLADAVSDSGAQPGQLFERAGWDSSDPLAREAGNKGILAWFGFEEVARRLADRAGLEF